MSEHTRIKGKAVYDHWPYREEGFSYCKHCKKFCSKLEIGFNEGWFSDWMQVNCGKCSKAIWVCSFLRDERQDKLYTKQKRDKEDPEGVRIFVKDDKKCVVCKKPTNHYDCVAHGGPLKNKRDSYWCSKKCHDKVHDEWRKKK